MNNYQIEVVEPKAIKLLEDMASKNLIKLLPVEPKEQFRELLAKLRSVKNPPTLQEITKEVEIVRANRYARRRKN